MKKPSQKLKSPVRVLVTGSDHFNHSLTRCLKAIGAKPIIAPLLEIAPMKIPDERIGQICAKDYAAVVMTSANAAKAFLELIDGRQDLIFRPEVVVIAVGAKTKECLDKLGVRTDFVPPEYSVESLLANYNLKPLKGLAVLHPAGASGVGQLEQKLGKLGCMVDTLVLYENRLPPGAGENISQIFSEAPAPEWAVLASPSAADRLFSFISPDALTMLGTRIIAIGKRTEATLAEYGATCILPNKSTAESIAQTILNHSN